MSIRNPGGDDIEQRVGYTSLKFKQEVWARGVNLGVVGIEKAMRPDEAT